MKEETMIEQVKALLIQFEVHLLYLLLVSIYSWIEFKLGKGKDGSLVGLIINNLSKWRQK